MLSIYMVAKKNYIAKSIKNNLVLVWIKHYKKDKNVAEVVASPCFIAAEDVKIWSTGGLRLSLIL